MDFYQLAKGFRQGATLRLAYLQSLLSLGHHPSVIVGDQANIIDRTPGLTPDSHHPPPGRPPRQGHLRQHVGSRPGQAPALVTDAASSGRAASRTTPHSPHPMIR
jgi:hypothetical protein